MIDDLERLVRLQGLDREIARLRQQLAEISPQVEAARASLAAAEGALAGGKGLVETIRKDRRAAEKSLEDQVDKRRKFQDQQGKVKTNKEYQALMGELEALKVQETAVEDRILALMEQQAEAEKLLPGHAADVVREQTAFQQQERALRGVEARFAGELAAAEAARAGVVTELDPALLQTYERIAKLRGSAVAEARDEFCLGCRTKMPSQNFMDAMRNDRILQCPHCHRILHYVRAEIRPAAAAEPPAAAPDPAA